MKGTLYTIRAGGSLRVTPLDKPPTLEQLQTAVGGYIEVVPGFETFGGEICVAFCDEEGKLKGKDINPGATREWHAQFPNDDALVGDIVVVCGDDDLLAEL